MFNQIKTAGGVYIEVQEEKIPYPDAIHPLIERLDSQRGALFTSSYEVPGRYTCWDIGFCNPPLALSCWETHIELQALNMRGEVLLKMVAPILEAASQLQILSHNNQKLSLTVKPGGKIFLEEERSLQPSVFSVIRLLLAFFKCDEPYLGIYGAFGYDLIFQFEEMPKLKPREAEQRQMVLYFPDEIYVVNHSKEEAFIRRYEFQSQGLSTTGLARSGEYDPYQPGGNPEKKGDYKPGEYADLVRVAKQKFACGDLFEVVPSQTFFLANPDLPSQVFKRLRDVNPSPYGFFINLGDQEYLAGASPEMYVRVKGKRVETCPISGTIKRGKDALEDAENIKTLLDSEKECSELTMCTDVDRNDKSRVCEAGSVKVIGRRQIEMYSRVIHTVDHVEGILREEFDAVDAFLTHMWVVTVTGAPKLWAMKFIEEHEKTPRKWYAGAVGWFNFNGNLNTGLVLRTIHIEQGIAKIRAGATLLYDSIPEDEEEETRLKTSAFIDVVKHVKKNEIKNDELKFEGEGKEVLLIDHQDSFVHTLSNYLRQTGAKVITVRSDLAHEFLKKQHYDLVVLSPGPGKPADFKLSATIAAVIEKNLPLFGVCLGLQGIVEYFGGELGVLNYPMHGKASRVDVLDTKTMFSGFEPSFTAARYHSLYAKEDTMPEVLKITACSEDGIVMAVEHQSLPIQAVQFHPEAILSQTGGAGLRLIRNVMKMV